jgi:antibiotic biosynthesis monooxygenase (ABM) superfamily enzyme
MAITFKNITTKPAGVLWFGQVSPENKAKTQAYDAWVASQPGFISQSLEDTEENIRTYTVEFDSLENYTAWATIRLSQPLPIERIAYNKSVGITGNSSETIS